MSGFKMLSAAAIISMMIATPVFAQAAIQEPGAFAFYHPNADVLNSGRPLPGEAAGAMAARIASVTHVLVNAIAIVRVVDKVSSMRIGGLRDPAGIARLY